MPILNEKFGFVVRDAATGLPTSGQLVELREGSNNYVLTEKATSGFYEVASIPTGKYSAFVNSVDSGSTFGVGTGQVAALGNTLDNVAVSTASEFGFQAPSIFKATLDLDLVTNKAIPLAVAADENKIISVNASGNYVLSSPSSTGFAAVFEANSASELEAALSAPIAQKTIINTKAADGYNYFNAKSISVYGVNAIYGANIDFSCQTGIVVNFVNDATDPNTPKIKFFNTFTTFGLNSKYVGTIEPLLEIRQLSIIDAEINDTTGNAVLYEKLGVFNVTGTKGFTQLFWDNTSGSTAPVASIFGRVGVVVAAFADYVATQVGFTPYSYITSIDVGGAIGEVVDKTNVNALAITTKGDAFLANPQTFTGVNTFSDEVLVEKKINLNPHNPSTKVLGDLWFGATYSDFKAYYLGAERLINSSVLLVSNQTDVRNYPFGLSLANQNLTMTNAPLGISTGAGAYHQIEKKLHETSTSVFSLWFTDTKANRVFYQSVNLGVYADWIEIGNANLPRVKTDGSTVTLNINASITDQFNVTAQSTALTIAAPTNPTDGQKLTIRIKDNGTTRTLTFNAIFRALGTTLPTNTTANKTIYIGCIYNLDDNEWDVVAVSEEA